MSEKLQELTDRIYREGVEKAEVEAKSIIDEAQRSGREIVETAEKEARKIVEKGRMEAESLNSRGEAELAMASRQAQNTLKQRITSLLAGMVLEEGVSSALDDGEFLRKIILDLISRWDNDENPPELAVLLPEKKKKELDAILRKALAQRLKAGLTIGFADRMTGGFRIESRDGSFVLSFTDRDFSEYFQSFVKERSRSLLFNEN